MVAFAGAVTKMRAVTEAIAKRAPSEGASSRSRHGITSYISCQYIKLCIKYYHFPAACINISKKLMKDCDYLTYRIELMVYQLF